MPILSLFFIFHFLFFGGVVKRHGRSKITLRGVENKGEKKLKTRNRITGLKEITTEWKKKGGDPYL